MLNEGKIGESEAIALLVTIITTKVFLSYPAAIVFYGGSAAWLLAFLSGLVTIAFFWFIPKLVECFPGKTFTEIAEEIAGPYLAPAIVLAVVLPWLVGTALNLRRFAEMIITVALPETPISIIIFTFMIAASIAVYLGINTIARAAYLSFPYSLLAIFLIAFLTYPFWKVEWLFPILGEGIGQILKYGVVRSSDFLEINFLYALPFLFYTKQCKRIGYISIGIATGIFFLITLTYVLTFPAVVGNEPYIPLYMMARGVYLGRFLQRIEAVFVLFWVVAGYLWISAGLYGFCRLLTDLLKLPDYRPLILPGAIIMLAVSFIPANLPEAALAETFSFRNMGFIGAFGVPAMLLAIAALRGSGVKEKKQG